MAAFLTLQKSMKASKQASRMHESMSHVFTTVNMCFVWSWNENSHIPTRIRCPSWINSQNGFHNVQFSHKIYMQNRIYACNFLSAMKVQNTETNSNQHFRNKRFSLTRKLVVTQLKKNFSTSLFWKIGVNWGNPRSVRLALKN